MHATPASSPAGGPTTPPPNQHAARGQSLRSAGLLPGRCRVDRTIVIDQSHPDPIAAIEETVTQTPPAADPTGAGWAIMLSYELGAVIEPTAAPAPTAADAFPLAVLQRWQRDDDQGGQETDRPDSQPGFTLGPLRSSMGRAAYVRAVERVKEYIAAGDIYQANIAHHLMGEFEGSIGVCADRLFTRADPRYGAMMVFDHAGQRLGVCSVSPELFLAYDPDTGILRTEPMKGTRPGGGDAAELRDSIKDRAELDMITDLMRNDLGRVCTPGSVRVADPRRIESHGSGVLQASSVIEGNLRAGTGLGAILRATFPPGSVTGAPKVRAMQIIAEIERRARDAYCGSILSIDDRGAIRASVSIRTAHIRGDIDPDCPEGIRAGTFAYPVGAGIVADSDPESEWAETLTKAAILSSALGVGLDWLGD